jgi:hypothetical protein
MNNTLTTLTRLINSPPGQLAAGGVLAGIVWKFFERVEAVLTDQTKLEIAVWLLGVKVGQKVEPWPDTFARVFDRVFGKKHLSWKCFWRSGIASLCSVFILCLSVFLSSGLRNTPVNFTLRSGTFIGLTFITVVVGNVVPDYFSLLETRVVIAYMARTANTSKQLLFLCIDAIYTCGFAFISLILGMLTQWTIASVVNGQLATPSGRHLFFVMVQYEVPFAITVFPSLGLRGAPLFWFYPAFFTSIWLWLYAGSGFVLKAARRFDLGFDWFNRKFDIEKHPLQSIGLVAGALVAVAYWTAVIVSRMIG